MIDLHVHSTCSDGTFAPEELAQMGKDFSIMALTDHDNVDGARRFLDASKGNGIRLAGAEFDVEPGEGYLKFHLLALGVDAENREFVRFVNGLSESRERRNAIMIGKLNALGIEVTMDEWVRAAGTASVIARPHLARVLVAKGYATDIKDAFEKWIGDDAPGYLPRVRLRAEEFVSHIHEAGGVAVMAHPKYWTHSPDMLRKGLRHLKDIGLDGLECVYAANEPHETVDHLSAAREIGLFPTAGSDFHGANKPTIKLGMTVDDEKAFSRGLLRALNLD